MSDYAFVISILKKNNVFFCVIIYYKWCDVCHRECDAWDYEKKEKSSAIQPDELILFLTIDSVLNLIQKKSAHRNNHDEPTFRIKMLSYQQM